MKLLLALLLATVASAAPADRIRGPVDSRVTRTVKGNLHRLARPEADRGPAEPGLILDHVVLAFRPSPAQQADLDQLLADQQNPGSPRYHQWLTPEDFAGRFGLTAADESKVVAWLQSEGLDVKERGRGRNWIAFSGTAQKVGRALRTEIRRFATDKGNRFANASEPSVPAALEEVVAGFAGLDEFLPESQAHIVPGPDPQYNVGASHYLVPEDLATIYNISPLYKAGMDGTGQSIVVVGQSAVDPDDIRAFKTRHNLPANDPKLVLYSGVDPGYTSSEVEGVLDLEWASAIAPKATIYYVYGTSAFSAMIYAINLNIAPTISVSYGGCELNYSPASYRAIVQQANAQGITILVASGDSGAASCDRQGVAPLAAKGMVAAFPAIMPEVTAVGGTQFNEGTGTYWASSNSPNLGSAIGYIPEKVWNESGPAGLLSSGGGISRIYPKPSWQTNPGITDAPFRHYPDISLTAAGHDAYIIVYGGSLGAVSGTSASAPVMAGIVALLNQSQVANGSQAKPGLGNINPQLYRLAQTAPTAFHDITAGDNIVPCSQLSPDCLTGTYGYRAAPGYDLATGLGSIDANNLVVNWNSKTKPVSVNLVLSTTRLTFNDTLNVTALVTSPTGGTPTGTVEFSAAGGLALGSSPLVARGDAQAADLTIPAYKLTSTGVFSIVANYSGDVAFSGGGTQKTVQVTTPVGAAAIAITAPTVTWPVLGPDSLGMAWQTTLTVRELAGTPAMITGFAIDGQDQPLSKYFPITSITASGSLLTSVLFRGLNTPTSKTFTFTGVDAAGNSWSRQATVGYMPLFAGTDFQTTVTPLVINKTADPACPWPVNINVEEWSGTAGTITGLWVGTVNYTNQVVPIFGTERLDAWSSLQGTICVSGATPPVSAQTVEVDLSTGQYAQMLVSFAGSPASPATLSATPAAVTLEARDAGRIAQATLALGITDRNADWTVTVLPANRAGTWLTVSPLSGKGPAQLTLGAKGAGFADGVYRALLVFQSNTAMPQTLTVPVMLVLGSNSSGISISSVVNAATFRATAAPGSIVSVFGSNLDGVTAAVNGLAATVVYTSSTQVNVQVPYTVGSGPAVIGLNNKGQVAGALFQVQASAPGIFETALPAPVKAGARATIYLTGAGEVTTTSPKPVQNVSVTVGGTQAFVQSVAMSTTLAGTALINFIVPTGTAAGPQPVIVTVGSASSPPVNITVQ